MEWWQAAAALESSRNAMLYGMLQGARARLRQDTARLEQQLTEEQVRASCRVAQDGSGCVVAVEYVMGSCRSLWWLQVRHQRTMRRQYQRFMQQHQAERLRVEDFFCMRP